MTYAITPGALAAAASGVALVVLGGAILWLRPRRLASVSFSAFAVLWGSGIVAANLSRMATLAPDAIAWARLALLLQIPLYLPLTLFASSCPDASGPLARSRVAQAILAFPASVLVVLSFAAPHLFIAATRPITGGFAPVSGALYYPVLYANTLFLFVVGLLITLRRARDAAPGPVRSQLALVVAAFLFYVSYRAGNLGYDAVTGRLPPTPADAWLLGLFALLAFASVVAALATAFRDATFPWRKLVLVASIAPFAFAIADKLARAAGLVGYDTVGVWRLAMVALFAYAIGRFRLFDLDVKLKWTLERGTVVAAFVVAFLVVAEIGQIWISNAFGVAAGVAVAALLFFGKARLERFARRVSDAALPRVTDSPEYVRYRKFDVYKGALESALRDGRIDEGERAILDDLRRGLGIEPPDAAALERDLRSRAPIAA